LQYHESLARDDVAQPKEAHHTVASKSLNQSLSAAKAAKQDEFYTQYVDISII
jgi:hypothetical protein